MKESKKAVLFDMDGVIVLTESLKAEAHSLTVKEFGGDVSADFYKEVLGQSHEKVRAAFLDKAGVKAKPDLYTNTFRKIYHNLLDTKLEIRPGAKELIDGLKRLGFSIAIVSSSSRASMEKILTSLGLGGKFDVEISSDDVREKKPSPKPYIIAMEKLEIEPKDAVIFEDSSTGIQSANLAGVKAIAMRHPYNLEQNFVTAITVLDSFQDTHSIFSLINSLLILKE